MFSVEYGTEVDTFGVDSSGLWRRVFCQCTRVAKQDTVAQLSVGRGSKWKQMLNFARLGALQGTSEDHGGEERIN